MAEGVVALGLQVGGKLLAHGLIAVVKELEALARHAVVGRHAADDTLVSHEDRRTDAGLDDTLCRAKDVNVRRFGEADALRRGLCPIDHSLEKLVHGVPLPFSKTP